eukprot:scaffold23619_cov38-Prasinocladus_malaysianus.AAC.2
MPPISYEPYRFLSDIEPEHQAFGGVVAHQNVGDEFRKAGHAAAMARRPFKDITSFEANARNCSVTHPTTLKFTRPGAKTAVAPYAQAGPPKAAASVRYDFRTNRKKRNLYEAYDRAVDEEDSRKQARKEQAASIGKPKTIPNKPKPTPRTVRKARKAPGANAVQLINLEALQDTPFTYQAYYSEKSPNGLDLLVKAAVSAGDMCSEEHCPLTMLASTAISSRILSRRTKTVAEGTYARRDGEEKDGKKTKITKSEMSKTTMKRAKHPKKMWRL